MKKLEIQIYYDPVHLVGTHKYVRKKQGSDGRKQHNPNSPRGTRKGADAHPLPAQDSEPPGEAFGGHIQARGGRGCSS